MIEKLQNPAPLEDAPQPPQRRDLTRPLTVLKIWPDDGGKTFFGYARNISRGGMRIDATCPREPGSRHHLEIPLPAPLTGVARCHCQVVWKRDYAAGASYPPGMGLEFLDLPEEISAALDAWVHRPSSACAAVARPAPLHSPRPAATLPARL